MDTDDPIIEEEKRRTRNPPSFQLCSYAASYTLVYLISTVRDLRFFPFSYPASRYHASDMSDAIESRHEARSSEEDTYKADHNALLNVRGVQSSYTQNDYPFARLDSIKFANPHSGIRFDSTIKPPAILLSVLSSCHHTSPSSHPFATRRDILSSTAVRRPFFLTLPDSLLLVKHAYISDGFKLAAGRRIAGRIFLNYERHAVESCIRGLLRGGILTRARDCFM